MTPTTITPYLFYGGRCEEALAFYRQQLGAEIGMMMRFDETPDPVPPGMVPPGYEKKIMHAEFKLEGITLMVSDGTGEQPRSDNFRLALSVGSEEAARRYFTALATGGRVVMPLTPTFWSPLYGMVDDPFGVGWMVMVASPTT